MGRWVKNGDVITRDHITEGFESTPQAFIDMLSGVNFGKAIGPLIVLTPHASPCAVPKLVHSR